MYGLSNYIRSQHTPNGTFTDQQSRGRVHSGREARCSISRFAGCHFRYTFRYTHRYIPLHISTVTAKPLHRSTVTNLNGCHFCYIPVHKSTIALPVQELRNKTLVERTFRSVTRISFCSIPSATQATGVPRYKRTPIPLGSP